MNSILYLPLNPLHPNIFVSVCWLTNAAGARTHSGQGFLLLCATKNRAPDSHAFERYWPFGMLATTYNHCTILVSYLVFAFWCPFVFEKLSEIVCICIHTWLFMK